MFHVRSSWMHSCELAVCTTSPAHYSGSGAAHPLYAKAAEHAAPQLTVALHISHCRRPAVPSIQCQQRLVSAKGLSLARSRTAPRVHLSTTTAQQRMPMGAVPYCCPAVVIWSGLCQWSVHPSCCWAPFALPRLQLLTSHAHSQHLRLSSIANQAAGCSLSNAFWLQ